MIRNGDSSVRVYPTRTAVDESLEIKQHVYSNTRFILFQSYEIFFKYSRILESCIIIQFFTFPFFSNQNLSNQLGLPCQSEVQTWSLQDSTNHRHLTHRRLLWPLKQLTISINLISLTVLSARCPEQRLQLAIDTSQDYLASSWRKTLKSHTRPRCAIFSPTLPRSKTIKATKTNSKILPGATYKFLMAWALTSWSTQVHWLK